MRLKYPGSLSRLYSESAPVPFGFVFEVSLPVLVAGIGVFLPHGENVTGDVLARQELRLLSKLAVSQIGFLQGANIRRR